MPQKNIHLILRETFPAADKQKWQQAASQEIEGKDPLTHLAWNNADKISFHPYYDNSDVAHLEYLKKFQLPVAENSFVGSRKWLNAPLVSVVDDTDANKSALEHLSNGADAIFFDIKNETNLTKLISTIEWPYCSLFFKTNQKDFHKNILSPFVADKNYPLQSISGALFWETRPKKSELDSSLVENKNFRSLGILINPSSPTVEVSTALSEGVLLVEELKGSVNEKFVISSIAFSLAAEPDFFSTVAKLKALRILWYQISQAYEFGDYRFSDLHIHCRSGKWVTEKFEPHSNMIKGTTSAMACILGGCDSLSVEPEEESNVMMNRIARNVSSILREESHFSNVSNAVDGAYAIDVMTDQIARKAWSIFQSKLAK